MLHIKWRARSSVSFLAVLLAYSVPSADNSVAIAVPDQISEGMNLSGGVRAAVTEFWHDQGHFPSDNSEAGIALPNQIVGRYVVSVTVTNTNGVVSVEFGGEAAWEIFGRTIEMTPKIVSGDKVRWVCSSQYIEHNLLPNACNGEIVPPGK